MSKLYPPVLNGKLPAFYVKPGEDAVIKVPFTMNTIVGDAEVKGFSLIIKSVTNNRLLGTYTNLIGNDKQFEYTGSLDFIINKLTWWKQDDNGVYTSQVPYRVGAFYKVQIAYIDINGVTGHYSNAAVIKLTDKPTVYLEQSKEDAIIINTGTYVGVYEYPAADPLEKIYSYRFDIIDSSGNIYLTSGDLLHNTAEDTNPRQVRDVYTFHESLPQSGIFKVKYTATTINGLEEPGDSQQIIENSTIDPEAKVKIVAESNFENGYVKLDLIGELDEYKKEPAVIGSFTLTRACNSDNYTRWETVYKFVMNGELPSQWNWKDFTVEQGYSYKYALQQYNDYGVVSNKIESNIVNVDFENCYLYDGTRQLKIKFNPKITSFKTTILEQKLDTLGGKHPHFFRNGKVAYKEFPISGLVSHESDDEELFLSAEEIFKTEDSYGLTEKNITSERIFKLKVLEWLQNGEAKLFRSPSEGNYIVRLLNIQLQPNDTLGRMLHTFSATAYEISDFNYNTLVEKKFLNIGESIAALTTRWGYADLRDCELSSNILRYFPATSLLIKDAIPGARLTVVCLNADGSENSPQDIEIGATGMYQLDIKDNVRIKSVSIQEKTPMGSILYSYESTAQNVFNTITNVTVGDWRFNQFIGAHSDIVAEIEDVFDYANPTTGEIKKVQGLRTSLVKFNYLHFTRREVYDLYPVYSYSLISMPVDTIAKFNQLSELYDGLYIKSNEESDYQRLEDLSEHDNDTISALHFYKREVIEYYWDSAHTHPLDEKFQSIYLYRVKTPEGYERYVDIQINGDDTWTKTLSYDIVINKDEVNTIRIGETEGYDIPSDVDIRALKIGNGVICECAYITKTIVYFIETSAANVQYPTLHQNKNNFLKQTARLDAWLRFDKNLESISSSPLTIFYVYSDIDGSKINKIEQVSMYEGGDSYLQQYLNHIESVRRDCSNAKLLYLKSLHEALEAQKEASGVYA